MAQPKGQPIPIIYRDDTAKAIAYAEAMRASGERADFVGSATIPRFTLAYSVGDRISGVEGRSASFQCNAGSGQGEGPAYPMIEAITWNFDGQQTTTIEFTGSLDEPVLPDIFEKAL